MIQKVVVKCNNCNNAYELSPNKISEILSDASNDGCETNGDDYQISCPNCNEPINLYVNIEDRFVNQK